MSHITVFILFSAAGRGADRCFLLYNFCFPPAPTVFRHGPSLFFFLLCTALAGIHVQLQLSQHVRRHRQLVDVQDSDHEVRC